MRKLIQTLIKTIKKMFNRKDKQNSYNTADLSKGFHPEILFLINRPYAEYVDYKEV